MRRAATVVLMIAAASTAARFAQSEEATGVPTRILSPASLVFPESLMRACCDDYCAKRPPCIPCYNRCCGCDDYCGKPAPCIACYRGGLCDRYCPKPCPDLCRPLAADYFTCAKGNATGVDRPIICTTPPAPIAVESDTAPIP